MDGWMYGWVNSCWTERMNTLQHKMKLYAKQNNIKAIDMGCKGVENEILIIVEEFVLYTTKNNGFTLYFYGIQISRRPN